MSKAATTRLTILHKAFELIYRNGYQVTSIDDIIATTEVTKGAFFYHFRNKEEMGLAVINEVMYPAMYEFLIRPHEGSKNPAEQIYAMMRHILLKAPFFKARYGCPAVNLIEEMSPLNDKFNKALARLMHQWQEAIGSSINQGRASGTIRKDVNAQQVACFIIAGYSGIRNMGKMAGASCYTIYLKELKSYLKQLAHRPYIRTF